VRACVDHGLSNEERAPPLMFYYLLTSDYQIFYETTRGTTINYWQGPLELRSLDEKLPPTPAHLPIVRPGCRLVVSKCHST